MNCCTTWQTACDFGSAPLSDRAPLYSTHWTRTVRYSRVNTAACMVILYTYAPTSAVPQLVCLQLLPAHLPPASTPYTRLQR